MSPERQPDRGLGDTIARATQALGIRPCGGCKKRQEWLNRAWPYRAPAMRERTQDVPLLIEETTGEIMTNAPPSPLPGSREHVVSVARSWIGTPYRLGARVKGAGCDCATLLLEVYRECGLVGDEQLGVFAGDWWLHTTEEKYLLRLLRHAFKVAETVAVRSTKAEPGVIVLTRAGGSRVFNHGGIVTAWPRVIHTGSGGVEEIDASRHPMWAGHVITIFDPLGASDVQQ
jgi:NlpC/P60 family putative phage cell wall peptidase